MGKWSGHTKQLLSVPSPTLMHFKGQQVHGQLLIFLGAILNTCFHAKSITLIEPQANVHLTERRNGNKSQYFVKGADVREENLESM